ncbi:GDSL esterase/lipase At5g45920 isoform X2 [Lycium barbarum]|nr:GDSL esterase/lipase At5g45920 isoform X2 [Lycium barbarum]
MRPKIYLFGDSITEMSFDDGGWGASLVKHFNRTVDVVLRGYSGYNTRWALKVIEKVFPETEESPLAVTVFFGANDACLVNRCSAFQHVPIDEYKQNLHSIVSFLKGRWPTTQIILISPPPIDEPARLLYPFTENKLRLPERTNEAAGNYAKACLAVAAECGVVAVDLWTRMQQIPGWQTACLS